MADASTSVAPSIFLLSFWPALISSTCLTSHSFFPFFSLLPTTPFSFLLARTHTPRTLHSRSSGNWTRRGRGGKGDCCSSLYANVEVFFAGNSIFFVWGDFWVLSFRKDVESRLRKVVFCFRSFWKQIWCVCVCVCPAFVAWVVSVCRRERELISSWGQVA